MWVPVCVTHDGKKKGDPTLPSFRTLSRAHLDPPPFNLLSFFFIFSCRRILQTKGFICARRGGRARKEFKGGREGAVPQNDFSGGGVVLVEKVDKMGKGYNKC